jgi:hypothetical protein
MTAEKAWNSCAFCGEPVTTRIRIEGLVGWANADDEIVDGEVVVVAHPACYMRATLAERAACLRDADPLGQ